MLFSVLIPAYKKTYLKECIDSILSQSFSDFEIIIVNDASPEDLDSIVSKYKDDRLHYYVNATNCGAKNVVDNWNKCLNYATGDFVLCMGDDDVLFPNCLSRYAIEISNYPDINIFHCRSFIIDELSNKIDLTPSWPQYEDVYDNMWHRMNHRREQFIGDFLYRREYLISFGGYYKLPLAWGSDDISSFMIMEKNGIVHINEPLFGYRKTAITLSSSGNTLVKIEAINEEEKWYKDFVTKTNPKTDSDKLLLNCIKKEIPHYFKIKKIETIAYYGFDGNILSCLLFWLKRKKTTQLSNKELAYALILAIKDRFKK